MSVWTTLPPAGQMPREWESGFSILAPVRWAHCCVCLENLHTKPWQQMWIVRGRGGANLSLGKSSSITVSGCLHTRHIQIKVNVLVKIATCFLACSCFGWFHKRPKNLQKQPMSFSTEEEEARNCGTISSGANNQQKLYFESNIHHHCAILLALLDHNLKTYWLINHLSMIKFILKNENLCKILQWDENIIKILTKTKSSKIFVVKWLLQIKNSRF